MLTNRDLYLAIEKLTTERATCKRSLEEYLRAVLAECEPYKDVESISLDQFYFVIDSAFFAEGVQFDDNWRNQYESLSQKAPGYDGWRALLIRQIVDLREMQEKGTLDDKQRYFGVNSPRGSRWYNFDPVCFLECAMEGSFGGWEPGDDTGRNFVPGPVAVLNEDGTIGSANPQDIERPHFEIPVVTWGQFQEFLFCGQNYE